MIRDVIIINQAGVPIFKQNFGECHGFGDDANLVAGLITAIQLFSQSLSGNDIQSMQTGDLNLVFHKEEGLLYTLFCEKTDPREEIRVKSRKIAEIFRNNLSKEILAFDGDITPFRRFAEILLDLNITQKNCGGRPECEGCANSQKTLPLADIIYTLGEGRKSWLERRRERKLGKRGKNKKKQ